MMMSMAMTCDDDGGNDGFKPSGELNTSSRARAPKSSGELETSSPQRAEDFKPSGELVISSPRKSQRLQALGRAQDFEPSVMTTMMPMPMKNTKTTTQKANGAAAAATVRKPNIQANIETTRSTFGVQRSNQDATKSKS